MADEEEEDVKCIISRVLVPGDAAMLRMRLAVLRFAQERGWVLTGGWGQHAFLRSMDPTRSVYDVRRACKMSDVDALCLDPLGDLIELASRLHSDTGAELMVGCGMMPNIFHLKLNWGGEALVDAIGVDAASLALIPTRTYPFSLLLAPPATAGSKATATRKHTIRALDPLYELSRMHLIVDSAFEASNDDVGKRLARLAPLEKALFPPSAVAASPTKTRTAMPSSPLYEGIRAAGMGSLVARVPGAPQPELLVPAADAIRVLEVVLREAARLDPQGASAAFYAPFVWASNYSLAVEVTVASAVALRVFCTAMPVPLARRNSSTSTRTVGSVSNGTAIPHLLVTAIWRHSLGDADGAQRRAQSAYALLSSMAGLSSTPPPPKGPATSYAGSVPATNVYARYLRRRATNRGCMVKHVTTASPENGEDARQRAVADAVAQAKRSPGAQLVRFDGRLLAQHRCATLAASRDTLAAAIAAVVDDNVMSDPMLPGRASKKNAYMRDKGGRDQGGRDKGGKKRRNRQ